MDMQWSAPLNDNNSGVAGAALANSTDLTDISATPQFTLQANFIHRIGQVFRLTASGVFSNTGTPTLLLGFYYGAVAGSALVTTGAVTTTTGATNWQWRLEALVYIRSIGASGTAWTQGVAWLGTSATAFSSIPLPAAAPATVSIDTTAAKVLSVGAQWGTANASNTVACHGFLVESVL